MKKVQSNKFKLKETYYIDYVELVTLLGIKPITYIKNNGSISDDPSGIFIEVESFE